jgi:serine phosphatase RsbU (regulator of sigma subunit)/ligand-binding sensor domain-containing protein
MVRCSTYRFVAHLLQILFCVVLIDVAFTNHSFSRQSNLRFERLSLDQGLSQSIVRVIWKDRKGFMWFGTESGLNRYDGYEFKVYMHDPFDSTSIAENNILSLAEDQSGALWIGTANGGLNKFTRDLETFEHFRTDPRNPASISSDRVQLVYADRKNNVYAFPAGGGIDVFERSINSFRRLRHDPDDPQSISDDRITAVYEDRRGDMWFGTLGGLNKLIIGDRSDTTESPYVFRKFLHDPDDPASLSDDNVISIYEALSEPGILWIGTGRPQPPFSGGGLNRLDTRTGKSRRFLHDPSNTKSIASNLVGPVLEDREGNLWIGTLRGLDRFDRRSGGFTHHLPDPANPQSLNNAVLTITEDVNGDLWLRTPANQGLYQFESRSGTFTHYANNPADPSSLSNDGVVSVFEDSIGVLWIGTNTGGVNKLNHFARKFVSFSPEPNNPNSLSGSVVRSFCEDRSGNLWVGIANGGLNRFDRQRKRITRYRFDQNNPNAISNDNVWALLTDRSGTTWAGTLGGGLNRLNSGTGTFFHYRNVPGSRRSLSNDNIRVLFEDRQGILWIGTEGGGLNKFDRRTETFLSYVNEPADTTSISGNIVRTIAEDPSGNLWVGTFGSGINKFDTKKGTFRRFQHNERDPNSLSSDLVQSIYLDTAGILWIGTFGGGLNRMDTRTEKFDCFTQQNSELPNNVIYGVLGDEGGNIWFSSNSGLIKYDPENDAFSTYDIDDGLQSKEFNGQACFKSRRGEMFFGGINGFNVFHPDSIKENPYEPKMAIMDFKLFDESVPIGKQYPLKRRVSETNEITLAHWQNNISFEFVALHYNRPDKNRYRYMLVNYDKGWRSAGKRRTATYTNLEAGEYFFRVRGSNSDGVWNMKGASIRILITPPWWKTTEAYVGFAAAALLLVLLFYRWERRRLINKERQKTAILEVELRAQTAEAQARAMQAENLRKTQELDQARKLQLSMLPKTLPRIGGLDLAVHMQPASEVGGDYYDFAVDNEGGLTIVVGDATGHGLSAGTMVSVVKSLFIAIPPGRNFQSFFDSCTKTIRQLHLGNLYMGLTLVRIQDRELTFSAAGMPPVYIFRNGTNTVEELVIKGMPLGAVERFVYQDLRVVLEEGDSVLVLSDGLPELFNERKDTFDLSRVRQTFQSAGREKPEEIVRQLVNVGEQWRNGKTPNDDVTFVVIKVQNGRA